MKSERKALGRGLSALISPNTVAIPVSVEPTSTVSGNTAVKYDPIVVQELAATESAGTVQFIPIEKIVNNPNQPRQVFVEEDLKELADSIQKLGVLQPVLVRPYSGQYQIVAGERRWRAAQRVGLESIPVIIKDLSEKETLQIAIVENIQRSQLSPLEEAKGYDRLVQEFSLTQDEVAEITGKNRTTVTNSIRLLKLPNDVLQFLEEGKLTQGHAKAILSVKDTQAQIGLAKKVVVEGLSVRALEQLVAGAVVLDGGPGKKRTSLKAPSLNQRFSEIEDELRRALGTRVSINQGVNGKGLIKIEYFSEDELGRIMEKICG